MRLSKCGKNSDYSWVEALSKHKEPIKDQEEHLLSKIDGPENIENVLEESTEATFNVAAPKKTNAQVIQEAAIELQNRNEERRRFAEVETIKNKLAINEVDPVALGIVSKENWEKCQDASDAEKIAKVAAQKQLGIVKNSWQAKAMEPRKVSMHYDPETSKTGQIMSNSSMTEDNQPVVSRQIPATSNSIFDPHRLDRQASEENAHDKAVGQIRKDRSERESASKNWRNETHAIPEDLKVMKGQAVGKANSFETVETRYHAPKNQVSMADNITGATPDEIREKLTQLFMEKIPDHKQEIRDENKARKEAIQRKEPSAEENKAWEKVQKPVSTSDIQKKLTELWLGKSE